MKIVSQLVVNNLLEEDTNEFEGALIYHWHLLDNILNRCVLLFRTHEFIFFVFVVELAKLPKLLFRNQGLLHLPEHSLQVVGNNVRIHRLIFLFVFDVFKVAVISLAKMDFQITNFLIA